MLNFSSATWFLVLQWVYALWQGVRNTRGFCLCYYSIQWLLLQCLSSARNKKIVWVNTTHCSADYRRNDNWETLEPLLRNRTHNGIKFLIYKDFWYNIRYKDLYDLDRNYSVARRISEEEAMLMMFNKDMHLYEVKGRATEDDEGAGRARTVIHGREFNIEFNSKLGGFLSTIPLILQARQLNAASAIASLVLLIVDLCRTPLYKMYDRGFFQFSKAVKLGVFRRRTWLYTAFGLFSDRWRYSDFSKGYAYITAEGDEIEVTSYVSCINEHDCEFSRLKDYGTVRPDMQRFTIRDGVISSAGFTYGQYSAVFKVKKGLFVS